MNHALSPELNVVRAQLWRDVFVERLGRGAAEAAALADNAVQWFDRAFTPYVPSPLPGGTGTYTPITVPASLT